MMTGTKTVSGRPGIVYYGYFDNYKCYEAVDTGADAANYGESVKNPVRYFSYQNLLLLMLRVNRSRNVWPRTVMAITGAVIF